MPVSLHPDAVPAPVDRARHRRIAALVALAMASGLSTTAGAADPRYQTRTVGDWTVAVSKDQQGCFLTRTYDRPAKTILLLGLDSDGTNHLSVLNANWSIKPKDQLRLTFRLSKGGYAAHDAVGIAADDRQGFVTSFEAKFPDYFAASKILNIFRGDVPVEQFGLDGSGAAVGALRACVGSIAATAPSAAGRRERADRIPTDPFAPDLPAKPRR